MDKEWQDQFDKNAGTALPDYLASCWSQHGFEERIALFPELLNNLKAKTALDVGCGPGNYCELLLGKGFEVTGVDYSQNMLARAEKNAPGAKYVRANAYELPFKDQSFDLVISIGVMQCLSDEERFISELCRVSKRYVILSTLRRTHRVKNSKEHLKKLLEQDSMPARLYYPKDVEAIFKENHFSTKTIFDHDGQLLSDCFFLIAQRKS